MSCFQVDVAIPVDYWVKIKEILRSCFIKYTDAGKYGTLTTLRCSGTRRLFTSWLLVFRHEERETHNNYYADYSYIAHSQPSRQLDWPGPESNLN